LAISHIGQESKTLQILSLKNPSGTRNIGRYETHFLGRGRVKGNVVNLRKKRPEIIARTCVLVFLMIFKCK
jgi:hypothetical protein